MTDLWELTAHEGMKVCAAGEASPVEWVESCLLRIREVEPGLDAWSHLADEALVTRELEIAYPGRLQGVPCGIKDIFNTADMPTGMGSPTWAGFTPGNDARAVHAVRRAGGILLGKTVTAEFAVHSPGATRNPWDLRRSPGTSSGGSAAAVAAGMVPWALGSQTAASIIRPASYCGVFGFKPSFGTIARTGMLKTADTLDQVGFFARSLRDLRLVFEAVRLRGRDYPLIHRTLDAVAAEDVSDIRTFKVGVVSQQLDAWDDAAQDSRSALLGFADACASRGVPVTALEVPEQLRAAREVHDVIYERSLAYYFEEEMREHHLVSDVMKGMVERGSRIDRRQYAQALQRQLEMQQAFARWSQDFDVVLTWAAAGEAPALGRPEGRDNSLLWTLCGAPSVSVPTTRGELGLPMGVQVVAARYQDLRLVGILEALQAEGLISDVAPSTHSSTTTEPVA